MLSNEQRTYLKQYRERHEQAEKQADTKELDALRQMNKRICDKAKEAICDLALIAESMPETQKEKIFTKESLRDFIKFALRPGDRKPFGCAIRDEEINADLPEPIYNARIFELGAFLADFGLSSAYGEISWRQRIIDINNPPGKARMWELVDVLDSYGYKLAKKNKRK
ncbi:Uncharacterised protein [uncultured archaeon]|nr:Uncharacterised protein [uncultured archaeon]